MIIRPEFEEDAAAITRLHQAAFPGPLEAQLVELLRAAGRLTLSLIAEQSSNLIGQVTFSPVTLEGHADLTAGVGLAPLAILPEWQGRGIGSQLVQEGLSACDLRGADFCVVLGDPAYYGRFGFRPASDWGLSSKFGSGPEFMAIELVPDCLFNRRGRIRYAPEFSVFGP